MDCGVAERVGAGPGEILMALCLGLADISQPEWKDRATLMFAFRQCPCLVPQHYLTYKYGLQPVAVIKQRCFKNDWRPVG